MDIENDYYGFNKKEIFEMGKRDQFNISSSKLKACILEGYEGEGTINSGQQERLDLFRKNPNFPYTTHEIKEKRVYGKPISRGEEALYNSYVNDPYAPIFIHEIRERIANGYVTEIDLLRLKLYEEIEIINKELEKEGVRENT